MSQPTDTAWTADELDAAIGRKRRSRWPWVVGGGLLLVAIAVGISALGGGTAADDSPPADAVNTAEVVATDLVETSTFDGTLGRVAGNPIVSLNQGVLTFVAAAGDFLTSGDVIYRVDEEPTVLLDGSAPAYRDLALSSGNVDVIAGFGGTVTSVPEVGTVIDQGDVIFEVNGEPVIALYGEVPAYRTMQDLSTDMTGTDVLQLETALAALGYEGFTVDETFSSATETAVTAWQEDVGAADDGVVTLGEIYFIPGPAIVTSTSSVGSQVGASQPVVTLATTPLAPGADVIQLESALAAFGFFELVPDDSFTIETRDAIAAWQADLGADVDGIVNLGEVYFSASDLRVSDQLASIGASVGTGTPVLAITGADIVVKVDLPADDQGLITVGDKVSVELPDNTVVPATVDSVATVATFTQQGQAVFEVVISLDDPSAAAGLDEAPVDVEVISDSVSDVVAVPVAALVALAEGGYAVEVQQGDGTAVLVAVEPGFYADGLVEVTETELQPGMIVIVP